MYPILCVMLLEQSSYIGSVLLSRMHKQRTYFSLKYSKKNRQTLRDIISSNIVKAKKNGNMKLIMYYRSMIKYAYKSKNVKLMKYFGSLYDLSEETKYLLKSVEQGYNKMIITLMKFNIVMHPNNEELLCIASSLGYTSTVKLLLRKGICHSSGKALRWAAMAGENKIVEILLKITTCHTHIDDTLVASITDGHISTTALLLKYGADIHTQNEEPLLCAVWYGHTSIVELLVENNANIDTNDNLPLKKAIEKENKDMIKCLLDLGANYYAIDVANCNENMRKYLEECRINYL